ncbi:MerR family transcriptional regulator [Marinivivus vitaminiproducens]|uniref:MerR family transcriptional regulator n=1 Tax=Marinivivus vitaminiproducens TaxID=3035935 RepID=UPI00279A8311|nr:MerR family transcriptional regulator [Geminicoccaceae bacterium SCSIO 64248]
MTGVLEAREPLDLDARGGGGRKSAGAFRTISEVAGDLDVAQHVLRFWESKFPQVRPLKRGGGRRYYRPEDVDILRQIRSLLYDQGYTIKGAQQCLKTTRRRGGQPASPLPPAPPALELTSAKPQPMPELPDLVRHRLTRLRDELEAARSQLRATLSGDRR